MNFELLTTILKDELEATEEAGVFTLPDSQRVTILVSGPSDLVPVPKVRSVRVLDEYLDFVTEDGHFFIARNAVFAVKSEGGANRQDKRPGFH